MICAITDFANVSEDDLRAINDFTYVSEEVCCLKTSSKKQQEEKPKITN